MGNPQGRQSALKPVLVITGGVIALFALVFAELYTINRPNYRDLEREYDKISATIPLEWQLVSKENDSGLFGLFCPEIDNSSCPNLNARFSNTTPPTSSAESIAKLNELISRAGFENTNDSYQKCDQQDIEQREYSCGSRGRKGRIILYLNLSSRSPKGQKGNWAYLSLTRYEK